jgi:hypothetical protein
MAEDWLMWAMTVAGVELLAWSFGRWEAASFINVVLLIFVGWYYGTEDAISTMDEEYPG